MVTTPLIARVVVDVPSQALTEPFDYSVPEALAGAVVVGCPVAVPFGTRPCVGYVVAMVRQSEYSGVLKEVAAVLGRPVFDGHAVGLAEWMATEYVAPLSETLRLFLPPGGAPKAVKTADGWTYQGRQMAMGTERLVFAVSASDFVPRPNASVQRAVLQAIADGPVSVSELAADIAGARSAVAALEKAGAITTVARLKYRVPAHSRSAAPRHTHSAEQSRAIDEIDGRVASGGGVVLLEGITGSGKTEVYLSAIERAIAGGRSAIVLVPEISLTPQTVGRFRSRLGDDVAVIHSRLSAGERFDQWQLALEGRVRVVVGARSALFAPVQDLALVVIDEEHEPSYKQNASPRYNARDVAERLCAERGATLVLGSATPSMEARERARTGAYGHVRLTHRVGGARPPEVEIVDMTREFSEGHRSIYSRALQEALTVVADRGEKAVLFLNRRGFASFLLCRECGFVPECESCSVSLTYHEEGARLQCHHCGASHPVPPTCPRCGSAYLRKFGAGTQRAEAELETLFPGLPVVRMDADTTSRKGGHEEALTRFEEHHSAVLLGTQMIAKGLDYPDVTLVGVLNADSSMHVPDFRAGERTYQLLEQVSGRAGRGTRPGRVIIQTYWPDHPAVRAVATRDPDILYASETEDRSTVGFPPFRRLANVIMTGEDARSVREGALLLARELRSGIPAGWDVTGPAPAPIARVKGKWRWHVVLRAPASAAISEHLRAAVGRVQVPKGVSCVVDVDPVGMV